MWKRFAEWLERPAVDGKVPKVLSSIPASSDTVESEGLQVIVQKKSKKPHSLCSSYSYVCKGMIKLLIAVEM
jgi:hypothetical protein